MEHFQVAELRMRRAENPKILMGICGMDEIRLPHGHYRWPKKKGPNYAD